MAYIIERTNRQTGTLVALVDNRDGGYDDGGPPWYTECATHGTNVGHDTRATAASFLAAPAEWCEACQRILDGNPRLIDKVT